MKSEFLCHNFHSYVDIAVALELNETSPIDFSLLSLAFHLHFLLDCGKRLRLIVSYTQTALAANDSENFPHGNLKNAHSDVLRARLRSSLTHASEFVGFQAVRKLICLLFKILCFLHATRGAQFTNSSIFLTDFSKKLF